MQLKQKNEELEEKLIIIINENEFLGLQSLERIKEIEFLKKKFVTKAEENEELRRKIQNFQKSFYKSNDQNDFIKEIEIYKLELNDACEIIETLKNDNKFNENQVKLFFYFALINF